MRIRFDEDEPELTWKGFDVLSWLKKYGQVNSQEVKTKPPKNGSDKRTQLNGH